MELPGAADQFLSVCFVFVRLLLLCSLLHSFCSLVVCTYLSFVLLLCFLDRCMPVCVSDDLIWIFLYLDPAALRANISNLRFIIRLLNLKLDVIRLHQPLHYLLDLIC